MARERLSISVSWRLGAATAELRLLVAVDLHDDRESWLIMSTADR